MLTSPIQGNEDISKVQNAITLNGGRMGMTGANNLTS